MSYQSSSFGIIF